MPKDEFPNLVHQRRGDTPGCDGALSGDGLLGCTGKPPCFLAQNYLAHPGQFIGKLDLMVVDMLPEPRAPRHHNGNLSRPNRMNDRSGAGVQYQQLRSSHPFREGLHVEKGGSIAMDAIEPSRRPVLDEHR